MPSISSLIEKYGAVPIVTTFPEQNVEWLSPDEFERQYGYPPGRIEETLSDRELAAVAEEKRLSLTEDRLAAFERLARLWNGECVGPDGLHLLADRVPSWRNITADLDEDELDALRPPSTNVEEEYIDAFGDREWFDPAPPSPTWLKSTHIARKRADYDISERARTLINEREDLPDLRGDPHEGLTHRVGVGIEAARATFDEHRRVETYVPIGGHVVDLLEHDRNGSERVGEMLTKHHNNRLYRSTWHKLVELERPAVLLFDARATAKRVFNHWQTRGIEVPGAPFRSALNVSWTRDTFHEAANDPQRTWPIEDVLTITTAWDEVKAASPTRREMVSLNW
ncbi:hypothetical protein [Natronoarchaeum rubrum]|uniref:hypothetical protein n=1 Tax=Natronoarchaeum rubrum TaxID=755311 RepID=UPI0021138C1A|nr:hypothetical protein [Natronoarchaeum rubrum]